MHKSTKANVKQYILLDHLM